jgi:hypothetical protein
MADIYRGSVLSKGLGLLSVVFLVAGIWAILAAEWLALLCALVASTLAAYGGYRAAGGRHNPELAKATWEKQAHIDIVSDQVASWPAKVEAMFSMLEQEARGDYAAALAALKLRNVPPIVESAYIEAVRSPSRDTWGHLKEVFLKNPPER